MKLRALACFVAMPVFLSSAMAQQPLPTRVDRPAVSVSPMVPSPPTSPTLSSPPVTPELWVYSQELRRHDDPALSVRRKAELKADQRLARLAAQKWYGFSNSRPEASPIPFMGQYSPGWVGNSWNRYDWYAFGNPSLTLLIEGFEQRR